MVYFALLVGGFRLLVICLNTVGVNSVGYAVYLCALSYYFWLLSVVFTWCWFCDFCLCV